jgi:hypothetical protein
MKKLILLIVAIATAAAVSAQESYIQVPPDSTGKKIRHYQATIGGNTVYIPGNFLSTTGGTEIGLVGSPIFVEFTDGVSAYVAAKASQLPSALVGGRLDVNVGNTPAVTISGSAAVTGPLTDTQLRASAVPVSASSLPLPAGAATEAGNLATIATNTGRIPSSPATDRTAAAAPSSIRLSDGAAFYKATTPADTQPVSAASLPLPAGAATEAGNLATVVTNTGRIPSSPATDRAAAAAPFSNRLSDGVAFYKATTPSDTQPISAASLPLPAGAAQEHTAAATPSSARLSDGSAFIVFPTTAANRWFSQITDGTNSASVTAGGIAQRQLHGRLRRRCRILRQHSVLVCIDDGQPDGGCRG